MVNANGKWQLVNSILSKGEKKQHVNKENGRVLVTKERVFYLMFSFLAMLAAESFPGVHGSQMRNPKGFGDPQLFP